MLHVSCCTFVLLLGRSREREEIEEDKRKKEGRGKIEEDQGNIEEDRGKIKEDRGNHVFFSEPFLGNFRDAGVFKNFWADGLCGWTAFWGQASPLGAEPPNALLL